MTCASGSGAGLYSRAMPTCSTTVQLIQSVDAARIKRNAGDLAMREYGKVLARCPLIIEAGKRARQEAGFYRAFTCGARRAGVALGVLRVHGDAVLNQLDGGPSHETFHEKV